MATEQFQASDILAGNVRFYARLGRHLEGEAASTKGDSHVSPTNVQLRYNSRPGWVMLRALVTIRNPDAEASVDMEMTWRHKRTDTQFSFDEARSTLAEYCAPRFAAVLGAELSNLVVSVGAAPFATPPALEDHLANTILAASEASNQDDIDSAEDNDDAVE